MAEKDIHSALTGPDKLAGRGYGNGWVFSLVEGEDDTGLKYKRRRVWYLSRLGNQMGWS